MLPINPFTLSREARSAEVLSSSKGEGPGRTVASTVLMALALCAAGCNKSGEAESEPAPAAQPSIALPTRAEVPAVDTDELRGSIGMKLPQATTTAPPEPTGSATRCTVEPPIEPGECDIHASRDVAIDAEGALYVVDAERGVRRYLPAAGDGCVLRADATFGDNGLWPLPEVKPLGQKLDGPVYMRSGGPKFSLATANDGSIYAYDFLGGAHRVRGNARPERCDGIPGISGLAFAGKRMLAARGREVVALEAKGKTCKPGKVFSAALQALAIAGDGDGLILGGRGDGEHRVARVGRDGKPLWTAGADDSFADDGMCSITSVTRCGDVVCVADGNCQKILRFDASTGAHLGTAKYRDLFGPKVGQLHALSGAYASVSLKAGDTTCQPAIFRLP